ncbi:uncharacterized protein LOC119549371 [Drosophila subpulchrella]|uniref:uncharacterized protein LOC119549371 n=1 Tax=Drosophila subpulchrella TaxID=1486046 RepID=UPI0018A170A8|nr:uncharacterized protein LOC119549371 [Drosophila subpulchrella]
MFLKKCCFILPLNVGCMIIGGILTCFHVGELITHNGDSVFIRMTSTKWWAPVILCPILVFGTLSSILLIYAASKRKRGYVLLWLITYVFILGLYIILAIVQLAKSKPVPAILTVQVIIIVGLIYSLLIVYGYYKYLSSVESDDSI